MSLVFLFLLPMMLNEYCINRYVGQPEDFGGGVDAGGLVLSNPYVAIAQLGGSLYDSWRNRQVSRENTDKTIAAQKAESELAYQRSIEEWNRQNLYNTPQSQMERFRAGGLNPHLIYGQGSAGNSSSPPSYQPANLQYRYEAPQYGAALQSVLPMLMSVGTWAQNMRLSEAELESKRTGTDRTRQLIEFLLERNPQLLKEGTNRLSLFPYQKDTADYQSNQARTKLFEMEQSFRNQYGEGLFKDMGSAWEPSSRSPIGGMRRLQFAEQESKTKLAEAKASWSDFDITDPQALMMMVLQSVMGMAGAQLRPRPKSSMPSGIRSGSRRVHPSRRVQQNWLD